jgi:hypothetical protein
MSAQLTKNHIKYINKKSDIATVSIKEILKEVMVILMLVTLSQCRYM